MGEQFWPVLCRAFHYALIAAHIVFIGSAPRLAEDVVRLVPVFPPATRGGVSSVPTLLTLGWGRLRLKQEIHMPILRLIAFATFALAVATSPALALTAGTYYVGLDT